MSESSIVAVLLAVIGIVSTCLTARAALRNEIARSVVLRFVEMFETTIQELSAAADIYAIMLAMCAVAPTKDNLPLRFGFLLELSKTFSEVAKTADRSMFRLSIYFPDVENEVFDGRASSRVVMALFGWVKATDCRMKSEARMAVTDAELLEYCKLEVSVVKALEESKRFIESRREHFIRCYGKWRKKNLPCIKGL